MNPVWRYNQEMFVIEMLGYVRPQSLVDDYESYIDAIYKTPQIEWCRINNVEKSVYFAPLEDQIKVTFFLLEIEEEEDRTRFIAEFSDNIEFAFVTT